MLTWSSSLVLRTIFFPSSRSAFQCNRCPNDGQLRQRNMMALNRSPESVSPQNEFYLLYYYCSNLWPPGWGQFWPQGYHMDRIDIGPNIIVQGLMIKALLFLVSEKKNFQVFLLCSYVSNLWPPGRGPFWPHGHHMNNFGRGPLGGATYEISKLCTF